MSGSSITTSLNTGITLDSGIYLSPLTVTGTGAVIAPAGSVAVTSTVATDSVANYGLIAGGTDANGIDFLHGGTFLNGTGGSVDGFIAVYSRGPDAITNAGDIIGAFEGIYQYGSAGLIINTGTIDTTGAETPALGDGIFVIGSAEVINGAPDDTNALIAGLGAGFGVDITKALSTFTSLGTVLNYGSIESGGTNAGVFLSNGTVFNGTTLDTGASVSGIRITGAGRVRNFGTINGYTQTGINIDTGSLVNGSSLDTTALIETETGVTAFQFFDGKVKNFGSIIGGSINAAYLGEGIFNNTTSGFIEGPDFAVRLGGPTTLLNEGTIIGKIGVATGHYGNNTVYNAGYIGSTLGSVGTAVAFGTNNDLLIDVPDAVFVGAVIGKGANELELASSAIEGTIAGIGAQFTGFKEITFDDGAVWLAEGSAAGLAAGQTITGFAGGDTIVLDSFTDTSFTYVAGIGLELFNGSTYDTLDITGDFTTSSFTVSNIAAGTEIMLCYLRGTRLMTPSGEVAVETLRIGDELATKFGGARKIKWIGRQSYDARFVRENRERVPVCIRKGALGPQLPKRDLFVSPGHSMLIDGRLILAKALVNGLSITQDEPAGQVDYFQVEFETHDCVLAESAWSESYADGPGLRNQFHNAAEFWALYPDYETTDEIGLCAERPEGGLALEAALRPLVARAAALTRPGALRGFIDIADETGRIEGWAQDSANPELPVLLEVLLGEQVIGTILACDYRKDLAEAGIGAGRCHFAFQAAQPVPTGSLRMRRKGDGAEIFMTGSCRERAAA